LSKCNRHEGRVKWVKIGERKFTASANQSQGGPHGGKSGLHTLPVVPVMIYTNADIQKQSITKDNKGKSGISRWVNKASGKTYVGSSTLLHIRFSQYFSLAHLNRYGSMAINKALLKYGYSGFKLEILEYCEPSQCIEREQYYLDLFEPEYNIFKTAGSSLGYSWKLSEETKKRMSEAQKGNKNPLYGKPHSEETRNKISKANKGTRRTGPVGKPSVQIEVIDLSTDIKLLILQ
jgi:group I intron endonuclease